MRRRVSKIASRLSGEAGFTLVELLMATMIGLFIVGIATTVFVAAVQSQPDLTAHGTKVSNARITAERVVRELRQGQTVYTATSSQLSFLTHVANDSCGSGSAAGFCRVTYTCNTAGTCTRVTAKPNGSSPGRSTPVISGLANGNVFSYSYGPSGPNYIALTFTFPPQNGGSSMTVSDGAALRNVPSS